MRGVDQQYTSFVSMLLCLFTTGCFFILLLYPPLVVATGYTIMTIAIYKICHGTFMRMELEHSENQLFVMAFMCAALWPLYFLFGAFLFLGKMIRGE
tara:strand:- start:540 stop:830 length:291 start_codon:yes stop_codon:yes gene_type:complete